eukprot:TRINITY_DN7652_c0_g1_i2.p1 TRINITY_DN7652_c0_g1~~TRINITY_DN7652_c0_g1_i2.p1  ORF type:complete len:345 (+),score=31.49 TRINITY_DN7652_c0_g1_i2:45-1079(+)
MLEVAVLGTFGYAVALLPAPMYSAVTGTLRLFTWSWWPKLFLTVDGFVYAHYQRIMMMIMKDLGRLKINIYGDPVVPNENAIYMSNHQCTVDWVICNLLAVPGNRLSHLQFILKNALKYVPFFGPYFRQHGFVYVQRKWELDRVRLEKQLTELQDSQHPYWMVVFPEGTRRPDTPLPPSKPGVPHYQHVLAVRPKGFMGMVTTLRPSCDAIYDVTIAYSTISGGCKRPSSPSLHGILDSNYDKIELFVKRHPMHQLPTDPEALKQWLAQQWDIKDNLLTDYHSGLGFPGEARLYQDAWQSQALHLGIWALIVGTVYGTAFGRQRILPTCLAINAISYLYGIIYY